MSGILAILVPILNAGASGAPPDPWETFIFNDDEAVADVSIPQVFNLDKSTQGF